MREDRQRHPSIGCEHDRSYMIRISETTLIRGVIRI